MRKRSHPRQFIVRSLSSRATRGVLVCGSVEVRCALGRSGRRALKREGDGASPQGLHRIVAVHYRADCRIGMRAGIPIRRIDRNYGWCDAPSDRNYNRPVRLPYPASAEQMWRQDRLYDVVLILDYNLRPRIRNRGSAIFLHIARPGYSPTEGCIAVSKKDMQRLLGILTGDCRVRL